ncbi:unnamed protein product [Protopolystoma xenopodis]|uniref:Uncharacterized protein n=1 Tax=Protopolystoma xenopodis TaxID=117903 RepID=A0A3S5FEZ9_9PLAT|nr:unnamed protein product [Protopolystoma xenopodis]
MRSSASSCQYDQFGLKFVPAICTRTLLVTSDICTLGHLSTLVSLLIISELVISLPSVVAWLKQKKCASLILLASISISSSALRKSVESNRVGASKALEEEVCSVLASPNTIHGASKSSGFKKQMTRRLKYHIFLMLAVTK